jgi:hypothetical protein
MQKRNRIFTVGRGVFFWVSKEISLEKYLLENHGLVSDHCTSQVLAGDVELARGDGPQ